MPTISMGPSWGFDRRRHIDRGSSGAATAISAATKRLSAACDASWSRGFRGALQVSAGCGSHGGRGRFKFRSGAADCRGLARRPDASAPRRVTPDLPLLERPGSAWFDHERQCGVVAWIFPALTAEPPPPSGSSAFLFAAKGTIDAPGIAINAPGIVDVRLGFFRRSKGSRQDQSDDGKTAHDFIFLPFSQPDVVKRRGALTAEGRVFGTNSFTSSGRGESPGRLAIWLRLISQGYNIVIFSCAP